MISWPQRQGLLCKMKSEGDYRGATAVAREVRECLQSAQWATHEGGSGGIVVNIQCDRGDPKTKRSFLARRKAISVGIITTACQ